MKKLLCFLLLLVASMQAHALKQEDLLPPDEAFKFKAEVISPEKIKATWEIAEGYYLYRERFTFEPETPNLVLSSPTFPTGERKNDPNFGNTEVYHKKVAVEIPVERGQTATQAVELAIKVKYQGCADAGLCYPPQKKTAKLQLAALDGSNDPSTQTTSQTDTPTVDKGLTDIIKKVQKPNANSGIPVDQAFVFELTALDKGTLNAHWTIQPEHHLYRPKIKFTVKEPQGVTLGAPIFPTGETVEDEYFGKIEVYGHDIDVKVPILQSSGLQKLIVETEYQGCSDSTGICYPPVKQNHELTLAGLPDAKPLDEAAQDNNTAENKATSAEDAISMRMRDDSYFSNLLFFFIAGLGLAFTPCVFPMIPILSGIIAGSSNDLSPRKAFLLSLSYVMPMALTYAIVGVIAGLSGANLQVMFQNPWIIGSFAGLFVLLALSMFGFYDLQMPTSIQSRLTEISNRQQGGSFLGAGIMGILSALIVGPCVTAPLIGALVYIAQTRDALLGGLSLFSLGLGMGLPLLMIGTSASRLLPRAGAWMDTTKAIFGIMMLGLAIWMLNRVVPLEVTMALTGVLLVSSGIYMGALERINDEAGGWGRFWKSLGLIMFFYGGMILFGVAAGSNNLLQPLKGIFGGSAYAVAAPNQQIALNFQRIKGLEGLEQALNQAKAQNKPVMLDFYADWCVSCKELEHNTFKDPQVIAALGNTLLIQADVTEDDEKDQALNKHFGLFGPPQILFFTPDGEEIKSVRLAGYEAPEAFLKRVQRFQQNLP
ncbi:thiol:disulfide interchange protein DsbD [Thiothrix caldifontis]|uniref:Thiol:disulfide interchange protein DsbD n=1 Tax=Thiothrix caldifontis TaxID=525918 RepID=A0A1H4FD89_9GAMM|nr:protein-disulfide reductase DsbD [Thiothrix caldifontis]SEA95313.1 thiol:disulfide interchange protein DsbD [Thiothrix caldifontis]